MQTIEFFEEAVEKAEANLRAHQASHDEYLAAEHAMINGNDALIKRKAAIIESLKAYELDLETAVDTGDDHPENDTAALRAEITAIDNVTAKFPTKLAHHRAVGSRKAEAMQGAHANLKEAQFNLALHQYRLAMEPIWDAVDNVRAHAAAYSARIDLTGLADSRGKYGKLPAA